MEIEEKLVDFLREEPPATSGIQQLALEQLYEDSVFTPLPFKEPETEVPDLAYIHLQLLENLLSTVEVFPNTSTAIKTELKELCEYDELTQHYPWISDFFLRSKELDTVTEISKLYKDINDLIQQGKESDCDHFLKFVEPKDLSNVLLVGLLRLTNPHKYKLSTWFPLKDKVRAELNIRGFDSSRKLRGL